MAVAIKKSGYTNIVLYNGGLKDWVKAGHEVTAIAPLPECSVSFIDVDEFRDLLKAADKQNCKNSDGTPMLTILDFRMSHALQKKMSADKSQIKTKCQIIQAQLDDFIDNKRLIDSLPDTGQIVSVSETGNRDRFLIQYLSQFHKTNIRGLKYGMRNWLKSGYPVETIPEKFLEN